MPTNELLAEIELLKQRAERAEHMARLWKRAAKKCYKKTIDDAMAFNAAYWEIDAGLQVKADFAALKNDARLLVNLCLASHCEIEVMGYHCQCEFCEAARRIIEATKE